MPVKRRLAKARHHKITDAALDAFEAGDDAALDRELKLPPWYTSPLDGGLDYDKPAYMIGSNAGGAQTWEAAKELRAALREGLKARGASAV